MGDGRMAILLGTPSVRLPETFSGRRLTGGSPVSFGEAAAIRNRGIHIRFLPTRLLSRESKLRQSFCL